MGGTAPQGFPCGSVGAGQHPGDGESPARACALSPSTRVRSLTSRPTRSARFAGSPKGQSSCTLGGRAFCLGVTMPADINHRSSSPPPRPPSRACLGRTSSRAGRQHGGAVGCPVAECGARAAQACAGLAALAGTYLGEIVLRELLLLQHGRALQCVRVDLLAGHLLVLLGWKKAQGDFSSAPHPRLRATGSTSHLGSRVWGEGRDPGQAAAPRDPGPINRHPCGWTLTLDFISLGAPGLRFTGG